jgi:hypothetical protein
MAEHVVALQPVQSRSRLAQAGRSTTTRGAPFLSVVTHNLRGFWPIPLPNTSFRYIGCTAASCLRNSGVTRSRAP